MNLYFQKQITDMEKLCTAKNWDSSNPVISQSLDFSLTFATLFLPGARFCNEQWDDPYDQNIFHILHTDEPFHLKIKIGVSLLKYAYQLAKNIYITTCEMYH